MSRQPGGWLRSSHPLKLSLIHILDYAEAGDNVGVLLRGINREEIQRGQVLAKPGSVHPHKKFKSQVYILSKDEGGRHTPFFANYRPQFYFRTTDVTGVIELPEGVEMVGWIAESPQPMSYGARQGD